MRAWYLCMDVGGTELKAAAVATDGTIGPLRHFPAMADADAPTLLAHFAEVLQAVRPAGEEVRGARLAFPGPFDYARGICLLQGLAKYDALYGVNLHEELAARLGFDDILFANDASAFGLGEMAFGEAKGAARGLFICIGTGCGSAFGVNGRLAAPGTPGVPASGFLYDAPFLDSCIDDYISRRGLLALSGEYLGEELDGLALSQRAGAGDEAAARCFLAFGQRVRQALEPFLRDFAPEVLCLGGQITKSADLFLPPLAARCRDAGIRLYVTQDTSRRVLQGLTCL